MSMVHLSRHTLLEDLEDQGWTSDLRFAHQEMEVFGHENVAEDTEAIMLTHIFQRLQEEQLDAIVRKERSPLVTTARDEVKVVGPVASLKTGGHK
jgi:hypothetical protein